MPEDAIINSPTGKHLVGKFTDQGNGIFTSEIEVSEIGLYQTNNGELLALTHVGPENPREFTDVLSTEKLLTDIAEQSSGSVKRLSQDGANVPRILPVRLGSPATGNGWIGLRNTNSTVLKGIDRVGLFAGLLGLALLLLGFAATWVREGR